MAGAHAPRPRHSKNNFGGSSQAFAQRSLQLAHLGSSLGSLLTVISCFISSAGFITFGCYLRSRKIVLAFHLILACSNLISFEQYSFLFSSAKITDHLDLIQNLVNVCLVAATSKTKLILTVIYPFRDRPWLQYFPRYHETIQQSTHYGE